VDRAVNPDLHEKIDDIIKVKTEDDFAFEAKIVALNSQYRKLGLTGAVTSVGKEFTCYATCDSLIFRKLNSESDR